MGYSEFFPLLFLTFGFLTVRYSAVAKIVNAVIINPKISSISGVICSAVVDDAEFKLITTLCVLW